MEDIFKRGERVALFTAGATVLFAGLKALAGFALGSVVLLAGALHGISDSVTTFLAWLGLRIAKREPTERFPYGFYKAENIAALFISLFIFLAGFKILKMSWKSFSSPAFVSFSLLGFGIPALDGVVMYFLGKREVEAGKEINSQSLVADGREAQSHVFLSLVTLVGLGSSYLKLPYVEGIASFFISFFILKQGFLSLRDAVFSLLDVSPGKELEEKVRWVLQDVSGLRGFERIKLRRSGPFVFGQVTAEVAGKTHVERASRVSKAIEKRIKKEIPVIDSFTVSLKSFKGKRRRVALPVKEDRGLSSPLSSDFGCAGFFLFVNLHKRDIEDFKVKKNPAREKERGRGLAAANFLVEEKIDAVVVRKIGPSPFHALRDNLIEIYEGEEKEAEEVVSRFAKRKLKEVEEPTEKSEELKK